MNFPMYVEEMAESAISRLQMLPNGNYIDFAFITDIHNCTRYIERAFYALSKINKEFPISFICMGGDYLCNNSRTERSEALRQLGELAELYEKYQDVPIITIKGNHDDNPFGIAENRLTPNDLYNILMHNNDKFSSSYNKNNMYGFYDIPQKKVRAIYINVFDPKYIKDGNKTYYEGNTAKVIGNEQLNWLANKALILPSEDWSVAVFAHCLPIVTPFLPTERFFGGDALIETLSAFREGKSYSAKAEKDILSYDFKCDFQHQGKGKLIGYFCGHYHRDWKWTVSDIPVIAQLAAASDNFRTAMCADGSYHLKTRGSGEESAFSIYRVYIDQNEVCSIRCGAGPDFNYKY